MRDANRFYEFPMMISAWENETNNNIYTGEMLISLMGKMCSDTAIRTEP